jgi:hypothetical protein
MTDLHPRLFGDGPVSTARRDLAEAVQRIVDMHDLSAAEVMTILLAEMHRAAHLLLERDLQQRGERP